MSSIRFNSDTHQHPSYSQGYGQPHAGSQPAYQAHQSNTLHQAPAPQYAPQAHVSVSLGDMYKALNQTKADIKSIRGWHGSRLAVAGGIAGGAAAVAGAGAATFFTGGIAAVGIGAAAAGAGVAVGGGMAGMFKTWFGKRQCQKNEQLMDKVVLLTQLRKTLKAQKATLSPAQRQLYKDVKKVSNKVDRSSLKEAVNMIGRTAAGVAGGAASVVVIGAFVAAADSADMDNGCFCFGTTPSLGLGLDRGGNSGVGSRSTDASGVMLAPDQLNKLTTPLA